MAFDNFTDGEIREVYSLSKSGWSVRQIVNGFKGSVGTIQRILRPETDEQYARVNYALHSRSNAAPPRSNGAQISNPAPPPSPSIPELPRPVFSRKNPSRTIVKPNSPNAYQCSKCRDQYSLPQWHPNEYICPKALPFYAQHRRA